jgi:DNA repair photolyase
MELATDTEKRFNQLEKIIEKGISHFVEVGTALMLIKKEKLYRILFSTFEEYCRQRWGFQRDYANKMIRSATVAQNLDTVVSKKPTSERQLRPLTHLKPEQQKKAWKKAVDIAPEGRVMARHVETVVAEIESENEPVEPIEPLEIDEVIEDTLILKKLKKYWDLADKIERQIFLQWIGEGEARK